MSTGARMREARKRAGLSQAQLAAAAGVNQATISRWERDGVYAAQALSAVARALGVDIGELLHDAPDLPPTGTEDL